MTNAQLSSVESRWLSECPIPKLLIVSQPGAIIQSRSLEFCRTWPNQTEVTVQGVPFLQEDSPDEIGKALQGFVKSNQKPNFSGGSL